MKPIALSVPEELARSCVAMTRTVARCQNGEPLDRVFARTLGRPLPASLIVAAVEVDGRWCTAHVIQGGVVCLWHPVTGWEIRTLTPEGRKASDRAANVATELAKTESRALNVLAAPTAKAVADSAGEWLKGSLS